ncbi:MAG: hypothetical protein ACQXXF_04610, partial [Thermoplasmatota archaeon]
EEDIENIWKRIKNIPKKIMTLNEICEKNSKDELIKVLISILFLAYENKILVYQKQFPYGKIFIKNIEYS